MDKSLEESCERIVESLKRSDINFLAIDFDRTIVSEHTGGKWVGSIADLVGFIRPEFRCLIPIAAANGIFIAVVTFSPQVHIIRQVLRTAFPRIENRICIRGEDKTWAYEGMGDRSGKQPHMASAAEEIVSKNPTIEITRSSTLLIDDDPNNIRVALRNSVRAVQLFPDNPRRVINDLLALQHMKGSARHSS